MFKEKIRDVLLHIDKETLLLFYLHMSPIILVPTSPLSHSPSSHSSEIRAFPTLVEICEPEVICLKGEILWLHSILYLTSCLYTPS